MDDFYKRMIELAFKEPAEEIIKKLSEEEIMKVFYDKGWIKPGEAAFEEFPPEEEDHKGYHYSYLLEGVSNMTEEDFFKFAEKEGWVKPLEDFFEIKNSQRKSSKHHIAEETVEYTKYKTGDIVFIKKFKYENGDDGFDHMFIILWDSLVIPIKHFTVLLSSKTWNKKYHTNYFLQSNLQNKLKKDSIIKCDSLYKFKDSQISHKIGSITKKEVESCREVFLLAKAVKDSPF